ncbi:specifically androgen-regulated gene protein-like isoform 2-T2 [Pholidichthys leucotaenia]
MDHLSSEERACLLYLEETIEALEVQEDSGLSNEEPDPVSHAENMAVNDISTLKSDESRGNDKSFASYGVPTTSTHSAAEAMSPTLVTDRKTEHSSLTQTSEPKHNNSIPESAAGCSIHSSAGSDGDPKSVVVLPSPFTEGSEIDVNFIPPPSDFMDVPKSLSTPEEAEVLPSSPKTSSNDSQTRVHIEDLLQRISTKKPNVSSPVSEEPPSKPPPVVAPGLPPVVTSGPQLSPPPQQDTEPRSPPVVAPRPKILPDNIILRSKRPASISYVGTSGHSVPTNSEWPYIDHQKARLEALRKLGLLKSDEDNSGSVLNTKNSPKTRNSWAAPSPPISPAVSRTPPSFTSLPSVSPTYPLSPSPTPDTLPAPAAFSDATEPSGNVMSVIGDVTEDTVDTPPTLVKHLTLPKLMSMQSTSLEHTSLGVSSHMAGGNSSEAIQGFDNKQNLSQLRNSRPRPASVGSGTDFSIADRERMQAGGAASRDPYSQRSLLAHTDHQQSKESSKLPRSQGISVLISPRSENEGERREALKKLGLLRD